MAARRRWVGVFAVLASPWAQLALAQETATAPPPEADAKPPVHDVAELSLDDLLAQPVTVASTKAQGIRETPGIVTVITRDEILSSGARDLVDVLLLVPGFSFPGVDVENVVDFGFRGLWAHEGKILILMDGQPLNDLFYGNNALGMHYPVEQIQSLEIIRGPGSVIYGGSAELAVINIITRSAAQLNGVSASARYGQAPTAMSEEAVNLAAGKENVAGIPGFDITAFGYVGRANRSDATYTDFYGDQYNSAGNEMTNPNFFNVGVRYKDLRLRFLYDNYHLTERDSYVEDNELTPTAPAVENAPASEFWTTLVADAQYDLHVGRWTITPRFNYKRQNVFQVLDQYSFDYSDHTAERFLSRLTASSEYSPSFGNLNVMAGAEWYVDRAWQDTDYTDSYGANFLITYPTPPGGVPGGSFWAHYWNVAGFAEAQYQGALGNLTLGARYEHHNAYGDSFVPRAVYTKVFGAFHVKLLYSFAFRAPAIGDIDLGAPDGNTARNGPITAEHTRSAEAEVGYEINSHNLITLNVFDTTIYDPLAFSFDQVNQTYYYFNFFKTGSQGFEAEYRMKYAWGSLKANYSFYTSWNVFLNAPKNTVDFYDVFNQDGTVNNSLLAGFPAHKFTVSGKFLLGPHLSFAPQVMYFSAIYGQTTGDGMGNGLPGSLPEVWLVNAFLTYSDLGTKGFDVGLGVFNALNTGYAYLQPYQSNHAPLPAQRQDFMLRLSYDLPL